MPAAVQTPEKKVRAHRSSPVWIRRGSVSRPNLISILWRWRSGIASCVTGALRLERAGMQALMPRKAEAWRKQSTSYLFSSGLSLAFGRQNRPCDCTSLRTQRVARSRSPRLALQATLARCLPTSIGRSIDCRLLLSKCFADLPCDGRICRSDNATGPRLSGSRVGRRTWSPSGSERRNAAAMVGQTRAAKLNDADPQAWLPCVLIADIAQGGGRSS